MRKASLLSCFSLFQLFAVGQGADNVQLFNVHEDAIRPSTFTLYEETTSKLADGLKEFDIDCSFFTLMRGDLKYLFFRPVKDLGSLSENSWGKLRPHMPERYNAISTDFKKCFDSHSNYILELRKDLSIDLPVQSAIRRLIYLYIAPENQAAFVELAKEIKQLIKDQEIDIGYRVFESGYGVQENYFMIDFASKNGNELVSSMDKFHDYRNRILQLAYKVEDVNAKIRDDLSYRMAGTK